MKFGGNKNAQSFFRKQGMTNMHAKIEKKYTSKAAQAYKSELGKLLDAEAAKRGEGAPLPDSVDQSTDLLANLDLAERAGMDEAARAKLAAARTKNSQQAVPQAKLASSMPGASKLVVTPPSSGNAPKLVLRKPAGSAGGFMKKKPSAASSKLRVNKLAVKPAGTGAAANQTDFDSFDTNQPAPEPAAKEDTPKPEPVPIPVAQPPPAAAAPVGSLAALKQQASSSQSTAPAAQFSMKDGVDKMKAMNSDFFSGF